MHADELGKEPDARGPNAPRPDVAGERFGFKARAAHSVLDQYFPGEARVHMVFPHRVNLRLDNNKVITFNEANKGPTVEEVPESLAGHWYLKDNGVKPIEVQTPEVKIAKPPVPDVPPVEEPPEAAAADSESPPESGQPARRRRKGVI